jgi:N-methylhydantoinase A
MAGIVVPLYPGVFSAIGLLMSDVKHDYIQSRMTPMNELSPDDVNGVFARLEAQAVADLQGDGFAEDRIKVERGLDLRYAGQGYEMTLPCPAGAITAGHIAELRRNFDAQHRIAFGHSAPEEPVEVVSYRVTGIGLIPPVQLPRFKREGRTLADAQRATRRVRFDGETVDCPVYQRELLDIGLTVAGPAVLDQFDCTTVLVPGQVAQVDEWKNLIVTGDR